MTSLLTPCAGKCSTVFGDSVCRGCRRFSHEVIHWNHYTPEQQALIWQRLDAQLDQILLPLVQISNEQALDLFLQLQQVRLPAHASAGRKVYHALRICQRNVSCLHRAGLRIAAHQLEHIWQLFEQRIYALAVASFELAWLRADQFAGQPAADAFDEALVRQVEC